MTYSVKFENASKEFIKEIESIAKKSNVKFSFLKKNNNQPNKKTIESMESCLNGNNKSYKDFETFWDEMVEEVENEVK